MAVVRLLAVMAYTSPQDIGLPVGDKDTRGTMMDGSIPVVGPFVCGGAVILNDVRRLESVVDGDEVDVASWDDT